MAVTKIGLQLDLSGLEALKSTAQKRAVTLKGVKAGAKLVQAAAKSRAPKRSGALKQSIGIKTRKGTRGKTLALAVVGARTKVRKMVKPARGTKKVLAVPGKYAHLVEKGTKPHGGHPGARAQPFLKPGFDSVKDQAGAAGMKAMGDEIQRLIAKEAAKLGRK